MGVDGLRRCLRGLPGHATLVHEAVVGLERGVLVGPEGVLASTDLDLPGGAGGAEVRLGKVGYRKPRSSAARMSATEGFGLLVCATTIWGAAPHNKQ